MQKLGGESKIQYKWSLKIDPGKPYLEGGFRSSHGHADAQTGGPSKGSLVCVAWARWQQGGASCALASPSLPAPAALQWQSTELSVNRKRHFFPCCVRKQSDLAVLTICLQHSSLRGMRQELAHLSYEFPIIFHRRCKLHSSCLFWVHCCGLRVCYWAQAILCSQFQIFAT